MQTRLTERILVLTLAQVHISIFLLPQSDLPLAYLANSDIFHPVNSADNATSNHTSYFWLLWVLLILYSTWTRLLHLWSESTLQYCWHSWFFHLQPRQWDCRMFFRLPLGSVSRLLKFSFLLEYYAMSCFEAHCKNYINNNYSKW